MQPNFERQRPLKADQECLRKRRRYIDEAEVSLVPSLLSKESRFALCGTILITQHVGCMVTCNKDEVAKALDLLEMMELFLTGKSKKLIK